MALPQNIAHLSLLYKSRVVKAGVNKRHSSLALAQEPLGAGTPDRDR